MCTRHWIYCRRLIVAFVFVCTRCGVDVVWRWIQADIWPMDMVIRFWIPIKKMEIPSTKSGRDQFFSCLKYRHQFKVMKFKREKIRFVWCTLAISCFLAFAQCNFDHLHVVNEMMNCTRHQHNFFFAVHPIRKSVQMNSSKIKMNGTVDYFWTFSSSATYISYGSLVVVAI